MSEISRMDEIYEGSSLTLIALYGNSAEAGLPRLRADKGCKSNQGYVRIGNTEIVDMGSLRRQYVESTWSKRAWTYQEGLLSTRCLYFTQDGLYFECNRAASSEDIDDFACLDIADEFDGFNQKCGCGIGNARKSRNKFSLPFEKGMSQRNNAFGAFYRFLSSYTLRKTTMESDFLHASRAVLDRLCHTYLISECISGIPVDLLPEVLTFTAEYTMDHRKGFPTWSWAGWKPAEESLPDEGNYLIGWRTLRPDISNALKCIEMSAVYIGALKTSDNNYYLRQIYSNPKPLSYTVPNRENLQSNLLSALRSSQVTISDACFEKLWNNTLVLETTVLHIPPRSPLNHHKTKSSSEDGWECKVGLFEKTMIDQWIQENTEREGLDLILLYQTVPSLYSEISDNPDRYYGCESYLLVIRRKHPAKNQSIAQASTEQVWIAERVSAEMVTLQLRRNYYPLDTILGEAKKELFSYGTAFPMRVALQ